MRAVAYVNKFLRAKGGGGNNFKNLDSLLGLKPVLVPRKFLGRFTPLRMAFLDIAFIRFLSSAAYAGRAWVSLLLTTDEEEMQWRAL